MKYFTRVSVAMIYFTHWTDKNILPSRDFNLSQFIHGRWLEGQRSASQVSCRASKITCKSTWITNSNSQANPQLLSTEVLLSFSWLGSILLSQAPAKSKEMQLNLGCTRGTSTFILTWTLGILHYLPPLWCVLHLKITSDLEFMWALKKKIKSIAHLSFSVDEVSVFLTIWAWNSLWVNPNNT